MDRREFGKLLAMAVAVPSFAGLAESQKKKMPLKMKYKGWDCVIERLPHKRKCIQAYCRKGNFHGATLFDRDDSLAKVEDGLKLMVDSYVKRKVA